MTRLRYTLVLITIGFCPVLPQGSSSGVDSVQSVYLDLKIPSSPAFVALGVSPGNVSRPQSPQELGFSLLETVNADNKPVSGIALDFAPYLVIRGQQLTLKKYRANNIRGYIRRALCRTQLSYGTAVLTGENSGTVKMAVGLRTVLVDRGDPRMDTVLSDSISAALKISDAPGAPPTSAGTAKPLKDPTILAKIKKARQAATAKNWNATRWELGLAPTFTSADGSFEKLRGTNLSVWSSLALRLSTRGQLITHIQHLPIKDSLESKLLVISGSLRLGTPTWTYILEASYNRRSIEEINTIDNWTKLIVGFEFKVADKIWLEAVFGGDLNRESNGSKFLTTTNLKWAFSRDKLLQTQ